MTPVTVIDWSQDFVGALADLLLTQTDGDLRDCLVIFPHQRPRRHLMQRLATRPDVKKPLFLPTMTAVNDWLPALARELEPEPLRNAGLLDRAGLLRDVVSALPNPGPLRDLTNSPDRFFPWGRKLAELFEELLRHRVQPHDLAHLQGEVQDTAAALLEQLTAIHTGYVAALASHGWTTPGLDAQRAAARAHDIPALLAGKQIFIAGFYALTGGEQAVFRALADDGAAHIVWHSDPVLARAPSKAHWACREHVRLLAEWNTRAVLHGDPAPPQPPTLRFHEGFDLHSQLAVLRETLVLSDLTDTAVVLPDTGSLMPVLHHLPMKDVNISMGYPLERSSLFRLLETVLRLQETAQGSGKYYWRDIVALVRHPYIKMLEPEPGLPLRGLLRELERSIRKGGKFTDPLTWEPNLESPPDGMLPEGADPQRAMELLQATLVACLTAFEDPETLEQFGTALLELAQALVPVGGEHVWHRFPVDAECLYRLAASVVPALTDSHLSRESFERPVLFSILRQLMQAERVPFEAEPLTGLQVMGMLESRLLRFKKVFVLDAIEGKLPGATVYDPLLPDPLRTLLDLPDARQSSLVAAYNFHRLIAGAEEAHIFYQTGADAAGPQSGKAIRSRFVEQLLWTEEKRLGRVIKGSDGGPLETITLPVTPLPLREASLPRTPAIQARLSALLATREVSATFLDSYLSCPLRFFHQYLTPLREPDAVSEEGDPRELGILVHDVLRDFLAPWRGKRVDIAALDPASLLDDFSARLEAQPFFRQMPYDLRLGLSATGRERLRRFARNSPDTTILLLEQPMAAHLDVDGNTVRLKGKFDRVDRRPKGDMVLDYKTGGLRAPSLSLWKNEELWDRLESWSPDADPKQWPDPLTELRDKLHSVQLPLYAWLYWSETDLVPDNAAWVELRDSGEEKPLFGPKATDEECEATITEQTPLLVRFLVRHMRDSRTFAAAPGPHCPWCPYGFNCPTPKDGFKVRR